MFGAYSHLWYLEIILRLFNLTALVVLLILGTSPVG
jgi:hypothetical protein